MLLSHLCAATGKHGYPSVDNKQLTLDHVLSEGRNDAQCVSWPQCPEHGEGDRGGDGLKACSRKNPLKAGDMRGPYQPGLVLTTCMEDWYCCWHGGFSQGRGHLPNGACQGHNCSCPELGRQSPVPKVEKVGKLAGLLLSLGQLPPITGKALGHTARQATRHSQSWRHGPQPVLFRLPLV